MVVLPLQVRQATAAQAAANNKILKSGEWGYETDTFKIKMGQGLLWNDTPYLQEGKFKGAWLAGPKEAGTFWVYNNSIYEAKANFISNTPPAQGSSWQRLTEFYPLAQTTGQSTDKVMHQKAVTDAIADVEEKVHLSYVYAVLGLTGS